MTPPPLWSQCNWNKCSCSPCLFISVCYMEGWLIQLLSKCQGLLRQILIFFKSLIFYQKLRHSKVVNCRKKSDKNARLKKKIVKNNQWILKKNQKSWYGQNVRRLLGKWGFLFISMENTAGTMRTITLFEEKILKLKNIISQHSQNH